MKEGVIQVLKNYGVIFLKKKFCKRQTIMFRLHLYEKKPKN